MTDEIQPGQWVVRRGEDDRVHKPLIVADVQPRQPYSLDTTLVFIPGMCLGFASNYRPATWAEVEAAHGYIPPEVRQHEALCEVARVAADLWSCGACCDCSGCKKRNTPECDYRRLTAAFMRLEAAGVEVPKMHAEAGERQEAEAKE